MTTASSQRRAELAAQIIVTAGGSAGIGLEMARRVGAAAGLGAEQHRLQRRPGRARAVLHRPGGTDRPCDGHGRRRRGPLSLAGVP